jgi:uncharacterized protein (DUF58 family)
MSASPNECSRIRRWLEHDYFPVAERLLRRFLYNPLGCLCLAATTAFLCGLFVHPHGYILFAGLIATLILGVLWPWIGLRGLAGQLEFARQRIKEGEAVDVSLIVRNRLPWAAWGLAVRGGFAEKSPRGSKGPPSPAASLAIAPARKTATSNWLFTPPARGVYPMQRSWLCTGFPFGLRESKRSLVIAKPLIVWPTTFPVGPAPPSEGENRIEGTVSRSKVGTNGDVLGVRPYRRGDSPRRIHWTQSARHDRLIVCELQSNARPFVQLVLDLDPAAHRGTGPNSSREWSIRVFASFAEGWLAEGVPIEAVIGGNVLSAASGSRQLHAIMDALARIGDEPQPALQELLASPACSKQASGVQVVITSDNAIASVPEIQLANRNRRFVSLNADSFTEGASLTAAARPTAVWLWLDASERIPSLLRHGWKEALHGS